MLFFFMSDINLVENVTCLKHVYIGMNTIVKLFLIMKTLVLKFKIGLMN